jgi:hypothetical protein
MDFGGDPARSEPRHRVLGNFLNARFSLTTTPHARPALDSCMHGFTKQDNALPFDTDESASASPSSRTASSRAPCGCPVMGSAATALDGPHRILSVTHLFPIYSSKQCM